MSRRLTWDAEIDTPATVAVIGGGAIGVEAALYARFLGYYVLLIEAAKMAQSWRTGAHLTMPTTFQQAASPLGLGALEAHYPDTARPDPLATLTGLEFAEKYLIPLARTDLLVDSVQVHSRVMSVSRLEARRETPSPDIQDRADIEYRLAIHSKKRGWYSERADIVLDCTGVGVARRLGPGGGLAMGEIEQAYLIDTGVPDVCGKQRADFAGRRNLLFGASVNAVLNLLSLLELQRSEPETKITWVVPLDDGMPSIRAWLDVLASTSELGKNLTELEEVRAAFSGNLDGIVILEGLGLERILPTPDGLNVCIQSDENNTLDIQCDRIISSAGYQPDWEHASPLRIGASNILSRPVFDNDGNNDVHSHAESIDPLDSILTLEPHYYVLGSKSFGLAHDKFTLAQGHQQIRRAFAIIGGRENLDLYTNIQREA